ncbi:MAG: nucleotidyltransferase domain-containing protein [Armatimonadota bacterium]
MSAKTTPDLTMYDISNLQCITDQITSALRMQPYVRAIALFGSLADSRADKYSDIDMLVVCDNVDQIRWHAASVIRSVKPVLYYRKFSAVDQPSGRYWFNGESLFNRLDVSFNSVEEYGLLIKEPVRFGKDIILKELYVNPDHLSYTLPVIEVNHLDASSRETEVGLWVYRLLNGMKTHLRGNEPNRSLVETTDGLRNAMNGISRDTIMAGGAIGEMVYSVFDIFDSLKERGI